MTKADEIRKFVNSKYIEPARAVGKSKVLVRAGDIHSAMELSNRFPAVTSALGATVFETTYRVKCLCRTGPRFRKCNRGHPVDRTILVGDDQVIIAADGSHRGSAADQHQLGGGHRPPDAVSRKMRANPAACRATT